MQKWEYKCVAIWGLGGSTTEKLNKYGRDGWELIQVWAVWHYFKRPVS
jgi:nucleotidyltransferase/DNA polymerase involved in DNA repair